MAEPALRNQEPDDRQLKKLADARLRARDDYLTFCQLMHPHPEDPYDPDRSMFTVMPHHQIIAGMLEKVESGEWKRVIVCVPPRHGKLLADDTPVPTPNGWVLHGDLKAGDKVFGVNGKPTTVKAVFSPKPCDVKLTFSNGQEIIAHEDHLWTVRDRRRGGEKWVTVHTHEIERDYWIGEKGKRGGRARWLLPDMKGVAYPRVILPVDPYVLGVWLGDGSSSAARVTYHRDDAAVALAVGDIYPPVKSEIHQDTGVVTTSFASGRSGGWQSGSPSKMTRDLQNIGVWQNKHIPDLYLRSSEKQRLQLLAGLIDTDGNVEEDTGRVRFITTSERLRDGVYELAAGLGFRPYISTTNPTESSSGVFGSKIVYVVGFQPHKKIPCRLSRKRIKRFGVRRRISVTSVARVPPQTGRCIEVEAEDGLYLCGKTMIPTHNTEMCARTFIPWCVGRDPYRHTAYATYNDMFAGDVGREILANMRSPQYQAIFPEFVLRKGAASAGRFTSENGGTSVAVGRGTALTGRGFHVGVADDLLKDDVEASSQAMRDRCWEWFTKVFMTRQMNENAVVIVMMTRWHEDDVVGRLTNPSSPYYNVEEAKQWKVLNLPAEAIEDDPMGRKPGEPLWPGKFGKEYLEGQKRLNPRAFQALFQQQPSPDEGIVFKKEWFTWYRNHERPDPQTLRIYAASDHAIATQAHNDKTVMLIVGVDNAGYIWLIDCWWGQADSLVQVNQMIDMMEKWSPQYWWGEDDTIQLTIGPLLRKRKMERGVTCTVITERIRGDKEQKAQSIQGLMADRRVKFPKDLWWGFEGSEQMLKFPNGSFDDFVDVMSIIGRKVNELVNSSYKASTPGPDRGTWGWWKKEIKHQTALKQRAAFATSEDGW